MDHARHLSSPSPTSSFLFQHSDRAFKTNLLDGDEPDEMDGMHNMLSTSSASSTTTMTLLNDGHSHNPFARISLEEYSPLSLVDECDNPLAMSPNSLACGPNHPFKTSLSNLDVGVGEVAGHHNHHHNHHHHHHGHHHEHEDDVVVGARSMSPSLLSATTNALHHHLWSNSSTAITQNPALLASSSASFLLSQHSLMQQLEPQSLDEPPAPMPMPLLPGGATSSLDFDHSHHININNLLNHRPSSEPPPPTAAAKQQQQQQQQHQQQQLPSNSSCSSTLSNSNSRSSTDRRAPDGHHAKQPAGTSPPLSEPQHSSKVHLQLNHQQKLKELQQRLFGPSAGGAPTPPAPKSPPSASDSTNLALDNKSKPDNGPYSSTGPPSTTTICAPSSASSSSSKKSQTGGRKQKEADSSASATSSTGGRGGAAAGSGNNTPGKQTSSVKGSSRVRVRITPRRRSRGVKNAGPAGKTQSIDSDCTLAVTTSKASSVAPASGKRVAASSKLLASETAEPDTTTKSSECIKLADLLAGTGGSIEAKNCNVSMLLNNVLAGADAGAVCDQNSNTDKRVQHIQFQVSPSLTVVSSGGLMQPISIQQHQQPQQQQQPAQMTNNGATTTATIVCSGALDNQVLCRPITVMTPIGANLNNGINGTQIKCNIVTANELVRDNDTAMLAANWANGIQLAASSGGAPNGKSNASAQAAISASGPPMGSHQIAIQVICQDGTSLVLPVSSAATLNGLSLAPQSHQQLQAILAANGAAISNQQQQQVRNMLPLVSVANIVAQQQSTLAEANGAPSAASQNGSGAGAAQTSGLAASSPTLAALLDAGSTRANSNNNNNNCGSNGNNALSLANNGAPEVNMSGPQRIVSTNLLRKLMATNQASMELKRGEISLQPGTQIGLTNNGSLVTVCTAAAAALAPVSNPSNGSAISSNGKPILGSARDKRLKLENNGAAELSNGKSGACEGVQATLTIIEPQGLVVANGNTEAKLAQSELAQTKAALLGGQPNGVASNKNAADNNNNSDISNSKEQSNGAGVKSSNGAAVNLEGNTSKQSKMTSSTGNRQVDPTQPFRCEHCNSTFTRLGNFTRHKKIHTVPIKDGQRFKCDVCSKSFLQRCDLARHLHIHRGTEPHRCNICGKGYIRHSDLVTHQRFHNKEKPFGCPHCSKGFCQRGDLNRHLRSIHLQMKPILCPCCNRKFAKQETLLRHLNTAHRSRTGGQQATISLVTTAPASLITEPLSVGAAIGTLSNQQVVEPSKTVASLEAIQATLCKVQQSAVQQTADPSIAVKVELLPSDELVS